MLEETSEIKKQNRVVYLTVLHLFMTTPLNFKHILVSVGLCFYCAFVRNVYGFRSEYNLFPFEVLLAILLPTLPPFSFFFWHSGMKLSTEKPPKIVSSICVCISLYAYIKIYIIIES